MLPVGTRMYSYVIGVYPYVFVLLVCSRMYSCGVLVKIVELKQSGLFAAVAVVDAKTQLPTIIEKRKREKNWTPITNVLITF